MIDMVEETNNNNDFKRQLILYLIFAACMILLNYGIQKLNELVIAPAICSAFGHIEFFQIFYCSTYPIDMPELIGSIVAVGITYITKFFLDKFIVFKKTSTEFKQTSKEFLIYLGFAIVTTLINIGIQFILKNLFGTPIEISVIIALSIGYLIKFFLDRKYVFKAQSEL